MEYHVYNQMKYAVAKSPEILKEALASDEYGIELKTDGASYILAKDLDGSVHLYGDKISKKTGEIIDKIDNVQHLKSWATIAFPRGSQMVVEILYKYNFAERKFEKHSNSKFVNSIMLCNPEKANERQLSTQLCGAYVFDLLYWDNESWWDKDFIDRYNKLTEIRDDLFRRNLDCVSVQYAQLITENKERVIADWLAAGEEGGVLKLLRSNKKASAKYAVAEIGETPKRPMHTTYKIKQFDTIDAVIMSIEMPTKEYTGKDPEHYPYRDEEGNPVNRLWYLGMANSFSIGLIKGHELIKIGTVASGLDDNMRLAMKDYPDQFIGQVVELSCMSIDKEAHTLRHPRLVRMREDKNKENCYWEDVFE